MQHTVLLEKQPKWCIVLPKGVFTWHLACVQRTRWKPLSSYSEWCIKISKRVVEHLINSNNDSLHMHEI